MIRDMIPTPDGGAIVTKTQSVGHTVVQLGIAATPPREPDEAEVLRAADELRACAASWEPDARLLGNVTAAQIVAVCDAARAAAETRKPEDSGMASAVDALWKAIFAYADEDAGPGDPEHRAVADAIRAYGDARARAAVQEEREEVQARLCPEDVGLDEYVRALEARAAQGTPRGLHELVKWAIDTGFWHGYAADECNPVEVDAWLATAADAAGEGADHA